MKRWKSIKGSQGAWNAKVEYDDGSTEVLACVHDRFWREGRQYHDPWNGGDMRQSKKFQDHIDLMRSKGRVIMTSNKMDVNRARGAGAMKRLGYRGIFNIENFTCDDRGIRFLINGGISKVQ